MSLALWCRNSETQKMNIVALYIAFQNKNMLSIPIYFIEQNNPYKKTSLKNIVY